MANLAKLSPVYTALVVLNDQEVVQHASSNISKVLGDTSVTLGQPLPVQLQGWKQQNPWETEIQQRSIFIYAEQWQGHTLLMITEQELYGEASTILNAIDEGIHVVNRKGQTVFYNPTMAKMEGMDYSQVINKDVLAMFPSLTPETSTVLRVFRTREPIYDQVQTYYNNKGRRITTINSTIPLWKGEEFIGVLEVA